MKKILSIIILSATIIFNAYAVDTFENGRYDTSIFQNILKQLNISEDECETDLAVQKQLPYMQGYSAFVIPKIVEQGEGYKIFDVYILIVENETGKITHKFYQEEGWISDAISLENIKIDTARYRLNNDTRAFGVRCFYTGNSRPNPYSSEEISLFILRENTLVQVLNNYRVNEYRGDWNMDCDGEFIETKSVLAMSNEQTNGFYNIEIKSTITETIRDECVDEVKVRQETKTLRYINGEYRMD